MSILEITFTGNPQKYSPNKINPTNKKTFGELYNIWCQRKKMLEENGYTVVYIWEKEYKQLSK